MAPKLPADDEPIAFVQTCIRKANTASARRFAQYKLARSLREAKMLGASANDLHNDLRRGLLYSAKKLRHWSILRIIKLFAPSDKARIAFAPNLKRPKSKACERYTKYSKAETLEEAKRLGIWPGDVAHDISRGLLGTDRSRWELMGLKGWRTLTKNSKDKARERAQTKAAHPKVRRSQCKQSCVGDKLRSKDHGINDKPSTVEQKKMRSKEQARKRHAECRAARDAARREWMALECSAPEPLRWTRKHGWANLGKQC